KAAAAAKARTKAGGEEQVEEKPPPPSINEPLLNKYIKMIQERIGDEALEAAYINRLAKEVPTLVAKKETYFQVAQCLKEQLHFDYLSDSHGIDYETHMELYNHLYSFTQKENVVLKVKLERDEPVIPSLTPLWQGANWPERETYDLLGITFTEHPNLTRIMMPDSWVGHPLRKDYEPHDEEV
ncbi:NADH-quinone oxidoreductase subunit C, partial [Halalkalibacterium ligniniphilum]